MHIEYRGREGGREGDEIGHRVTPSRALVKASLIDPSSNSLVYKKHSCRSFSISCSMVHSKVAYILAALVIIIFCIITQKCEIFGKSRVGRLSRDGSGSGGGAPP